VLDYRHIVEENELPPLIENEEDMTNGQRQDLTNQIVSLKNDVKEDLSSIRQELHSAKDSAADQKNNLTAIKRDINWITAIGSFAISCAIASGIYFNIQLMNISTKVLSLEITGGSIVATEKAIQTSTSPEEVAANLNLLSAQVQKRSLSKDPLTQVELTQIGVTLNAVVGNYSQLPVVWSSASKLVNARFQRQVPNSLPNCWNKYSGHFQDGVSPPSIPAPSNFPAVDEQRVGDCLLDLDDGPQYRESGFGKAYEQNLKIAPATKLLINAHDVIVRYSGGPIIPFSSLICRNCVFQLNVNQPPAPYGQRIVRQLLTADTNSVQFAGSQSGE
jgi:hypothetical protein